MWKYMYWLLNLALFFYSYIKGSLFYTLPQEKFSYVWFKIWYSFNCQSVSFHFANCYATYSDNKINLYWILISFIVSNGLYSYFLHFFQSPKRLIDMSATNNWLYGIGIKLLSSQKCLELEYLITEFSSSANDFGLK